ncbi:WD40/YVTN/BNR-like repeat-containing protein [Mucilaginibacter terrigena]|uniref:WD40/YVTN/BNR-like repeat-containing protein n=1 Tax=Mucilaginibacter terrigena TaxID=2492395 RepID=UPI001396B6F2|nr:YCF48-related protein [Mucilaginibacter terrigena]
MLLVICLKAQTITTLQQGKPTSIRGLSVVDDKVAWVSGSKGTIGLSTDGGSNWIWQQIKGFEKSDFRDIEAFSDKEAVIISSGSPAYILKTIDGGTSWNIKYQKTDTAYFLDAMDFADKLHGFVLGDPINNKFLLLETIDGGETWKPAVNPPTALKDEAAFAASGTCLRVDKTITIVTGGSNSRILTSPVGGKAWTTKELPLTNGTGSRGAFSVAYGGYQKVIVGGNYANDKQTDSVAYLLPQKNANYKNNIPVVGPAGYQSCVEYIKDNTFLSTGTSGTNITKDGGKVWLKIDDNSYNVCRKAKNGSLVILAGDRGKIAVLKF